VLRTSLNSQGHVPVTLHVPGIHGRILPARALYQSAGFVPCGPFVGYQPSEDNFFMTLELHAGRPGTEKAGAS